MDEASIELMNRIRAEAGAKPLPTADGAPPATNLSFKAPDNDDSDDEEPSTLETREAAGFDNWKAHQKEQEEKARREKRKQEIRKQKELATRYQKLEGKGLAETAEDVDDKTWVLGAKKRQKKAELARKKQEELEEQERLAASAVQYTEADLTGVKVGHRMEDFDDAEGEILVLKDTAVDADDDDELEAVALKEKERLQERLDSKKRKRAYDPNAFDEDGQKGILSQYDEEIAGKKRNVFTLGGQGGASEDIEMGEAGSSKHKKVAFNLDVLINETPASDYMDVSEVKFKKPKKKKKAVTRRQIIDDDHVPAADGLDGSMDVDEPLPSAPKKVISDESLFDDDLQAKLAIQRRAALKKNRKKLLTPDEIAKRIREEESATPDVPVEDDEKENEDNTAPLVIDQAQEFIIHMEKRELEDRQERLARPRRKSKSMTPMEDFDGTSTYISGVGSHELNTPYSGTETGMIQSHEMTEEEAKKSAAALELATANGITVNGVAEETHVGMGVAATLKLLRERGLVNPSAENQDFNEDYRRRQKFLAEKRKAMEQAELRAKEAREATRKSAQFAHMTPREREDYAMKLNAQRERDEARSIAEIFNKEYKPNVQLNYVDEFGRQMSQKEAFKHLSHQFHGKGSGNQKTQKHLDKIEQEKKRLAEASLDSSKQTAGLNTVQGVQSKRHKQAGVRLQ